MYISTGYNYDILSNVRYQSDLQYYPIIDRTIPKDVSNLIDFHIDSSKAMNMFVRMNLAKLRKSGYLAQDKDKPHDIDFHQILEWKIYDLVLLALSTDPNKQMMVGKWQAQRTVIDQFENVANQIHRQYIMRKAETYENSKSK